MKSPPFEISGTAISWKAVSLYGWRLQPGEIFISLCPDSRQLSYLILQGSHRLCHDLVLVNCSLVQEAVDGSVKAVTLHPGQYAINEAGVWHRADVIGEATAVFITAGSGTRHRQR